jgi:hypothetical protein
MATRSRSRRREDDESKNRPIWSRRYWTGSGNVEVAIFENVNGDGDEERVVLSTTLKKTYRDGDDYKDSKSFFPQELPIVALAVQEAASFCFNLANKK